MKPSKRDTKEIQAMRNEYWTMRDPTAEASEGRSMRERRPPPADLGGATIGLLSIRKERSDEFLDSIERELASRGLVVRRFAKPIFAKPAPEAVLQDLIEHCDVVVEGLAD